MNKTTLTRHLVTIFFMSTVLSGCQSVKPEQVQVLKNQTQQQHQAALAALQHWQVKGKFIFKSPQKKFSASLNWNQQASRSDIRLTTFLGISIMKMVNNQQLSTLHTDGKTATSTDPQSLLLKTTGIDLPINNMSQWIKGATNLLNSKTVTLDQFNRVSQINLSQDNHRTWQIDYQNYLPVQSYQLPQKIKLTGNDITITIKISDWELISD